MRINRHDSNKKQIKNYTPHTIVIRRFEPNCGYVNREFESQGYARVLMDPEKDLPSILGIPIKETYSTGTVIGLPEPQTDVHIIVSLQTYIAENARWDLLVPYGTERDPKTNQITHCTGFCRPALEMTIWSKT